MSLSIKLTETPGVIQRKIFGAIALDMNKAIKKALPSIEQRVKAATKVIFQGSDTYDALIGNTDRDNDLEAHFGFSDGQIRVDGIIDTIVNNMEIELRKFKATRKGFSGGFRISTLLADYSDILLIPESIVDTEKGEKLLWLEWLILEGNRIIVSDHEILIQDGLGRSGKAIMIKNNARVWRVPPAHAGTKNNNWLTRALKDITLYSALMGKILEEEINKAL